MKKQTILVFIMITFLLPVLLSGCSGEKTGSFFTQLAAEPEKYNGETVTFTRYLYYGFEISVVAEYLEPWDSLTGIWRPGGVKIWLSGALPEGLEAQLYVQTNDPTGYPAHYGKVEITGVIEYGAKYGHMDAYQYKLNVTDAKALEWKPGDK